MRRAETVETGPIRLIRGLVGGSVRGLLLGALFFAALPAMARDIAVSDADALLDALKAAQPGDRLLLAEGDYGALKLWPGGPVDPGFEGTVTLRSADPERPAVFTELGLTGGSHITFEAILFDYRAQPGSYKERPFVIKLSSDITIRDSVFDGDNAHGTGPRADGFGAGYGLGVRKSARVTVEGNRFFNFYRGLGMGGGEDYTVRGNELFGMRTDGMTFVKVTDLLIEGNHIHSFRRNLSAGDHSDMIQFWTTNATTPTTGVTIRGNVLNMGDGEHTQAMLMGNQAVSKQGGGRAMFYRDIRIEENVIINGHLHGISIGQTDGLTIRNNTLIRVPRRGLAAHERGKEHWAPRIRVSEESVNVEIQRNITPALGKMQRDWDVTDNLLIQDETRLAADFYGHVFVNGMAQAPYDLSNFQYRSDGPAAGARYGASRLR